MLKRIYIDNYKCLRDFDLKLDEVNLLLGPNGSGKTSIMSVLWAIMGLLDGACKISDRSAFPPSTKTRWQDDSVQVFEIEVQLKNDTFVYRLEIEHGTVFERGIEKFISRILCESLTADGNLLFSFNLGKVQLYNDTHEEGPAFDSDWTQSALARVMPGHVNKRLISFVDFVRSIIACGIIPDGLESVAEKPEEILARDASNFPAWYWSRAIERPDRFQSYLNAIKEILDGCLNIGMDKYGAESRALTISFAKGDSNYKLRLDEISDGQRILVILYALLYLAEAPFVLFMDEPENHVGLREIQPWLAELQMACEDHGSQVILCSHHPELIDYFGGEKGILIKREGDSKVIAKSIASMDFEGQDLKFSEIIARGWIR